MYRCPTCIAVLAEPRARRCETCGQNLRRRQPTVLGSHGRVMTRALPSDRFMAERAQLHLAPSLRSVPSFPEFQAPPIHHAPTPESFVMARWEAPMAMPLADPPVVKRVVDEPLIAPVVPVEAIEPTEVEREAPSATEIAPATDDITPAPARRRHRRAAAPQKVEVDLRAFLPAPITEPPAVTPEPDVDATIVPVAERLALVLPKPKAQPEPEAVAEAEPDTIVEAVADLAAGLEIDAVSTPLLERIAKMQEQQRLAAVAEAETLELPAEREAEPASTVQPEPAPFVDRRNPAGDTIERYTLAVAREPVREIDPQIEAALDDLARTAREEILSRNAPKRLRRSEPDDTPWLGPIRKAWEPPEPEPEARPRWGFRRRVG